MWKNFLVAVDAVMPFVIYLALGYFAVKGGLADTGFMNRLNRFSFKLFYPLLMFKNVYGAAPESMPSLTSQFASNSATSECENEADWP